MLWFTWRPVVQCRAERTIEVIDGMEYVAIGFSEDRLPPPFRMQIRITAQRSFNEPLDALVHTLTAGQPT